MIYILSGSRDQASQCAKKNDIPLSGFKFVASSDSARGISSKDNELWLYGTYQHNLDWQFICNMFALRGIIAKEKGDE